MLQQFRESFAQLPVSHKAMVYIMWVYRIGLIVGGLFVQLYVFQLQESVVDLLHYNFFFATSCGMGFVFLGWLFAVKQWNIKWLYYVAYACYILAFVSLLLVGESVVGSFVFGSLFGAGTGVFWCAAHTQELAFVDNVMRDFYSSSVYTGRTIIDVVVPLLIAGVFWCAGQLGIDGYVVLFAVLPLLYVVGIAWVSSLQDYAPPVLPSRFFSATLLNRHHVFSNLYFLISSPKFIVEPVAVALLSILFLKSEMNIGLFQGLLGFAAALMVVFCAHKRTVDNRLRYLLVTTLLIVGNIVLFLLQVDLFAYVVYSLVLIAIQPLYKVSIHVYNLTLMDEMETGFYPAMLCREVLLWVGRMLALGLSLWIFSRMDLDTVSAAMFFLGLLGVIYMSIYVCIALHEHYSD